VHPARQHADGSLPHARTLRQKTAPQQT
jgi:hypothetical protein